MSRSRRRMILPERVLGRSSVRTMDFGRARAPILVATCWRSSPMRPSSTVTSPFGVRRRRSPARWSRQRAPHDGGLGDLGVVDEARSISMCRAGAGSVQTSSMRATASSRRPGSRRRVTKRGALPRYAGSSRSRLVALVGPPHEGAAPGPRLGRRGAPGRRGPLSSVGVDRPRWSQAAFASRALRISASRRRDHDMAVSVCTRSSAPPDLAVRPPMSVHEITDPGLRVGRLLTVPRSRREPVKPA